MPFCPSGSPQQKSGVADDVILSAAVLSSFLPAAAAWIEPFIGAIAGIITIHLPTLCGSDPPADPGLSGADVLSLVALGPGPLTADAYGRFVQLMERYAWFTFCECSAGATPAPPTFPTAPSGLPAINPPGLVGVPSGPCGAVSYSALCLTTSTQTDLRTGSNCNATGHPLCDTFAQPIPAGATAFQFNFSVSASHATVCGPSHQYGAALLLLASGTETRLIDATIADSGTLYCINSSGHSAVIPLNSGENQFVMLGSSNENAFNFEVDASVTWFCGDGTVPITGAPTCCTASDPYSTGQLNQILQMVTLIQRQLAPFAYVGGASHTGLTGAGVLTVPSLQGVKITLTTQPTYIGEEFGDPLELFDVGWFAWGTADGFLARELITHNPQLSFPAKAEQYTRLGYSLNPGVVATIQELEAETP